MEPPPGVQLLGVQRKAGLATAAIELDPDDTDALAAAYINRSMRFSIWGRIEEALADATAAIELQPNDHPLSRGYFIRAISLAALGRTDEAVVDLRILIALRPPGDGPSQIAAEYRSDLFPLLRKGR